MWSSPYAVLKAHFVKPIVKSLYDLLPSLLQKPDDSLKELRDNVY